MTVEAGYTSRLKDIGRELGFSAVKVGTLLRAAGMRTYPTPKALDCGAARSVWDGQDRKYEWNIQNVVATLKPELRATR